jgi:hypothetical protein
VIEVNFIVDGVIEGSETFEDAQAAADYIHGFDPDHVALDGWTAPTQAECDAMHAALNADS